MSRLETVRENWADITNRLLRDKQLLAHFLRFSAGMYKQSFSDAALIYQQNPYATKVATLETWNRLGRLVNKGEHSIAVFGEGSKAKHLFDITQTNGKRIPDLWKLTEDLAADLTAVINKKYGRNCKNIQEVIAAMSVDNTRPHLTKMMYATQQLKLTDSELKTYQQSFVSAVRFMVSNRCEFDSDMKISGGINLNAVDLFKDTRDLVRFCDLVQKSAKDTLLEMEREIVQILKQRRERNDEKRFILASTSKLGTGSNIQDRICAIHHLDIPWKPSDLTQQDGRGIRQGNSFDEVGIYHYLTEETFDAYMMGIITNKAKFINRIITSKDPFVFPRGNSRTDRVEAQVKVIRTYL